MDDLPKSFKKFPEISGQYLVDQYKETPSIHALGRRFGLSHTSIGKRLRAAGHDINDGRMRDGGRYEKIEHEMAKEPWITRGELAHRSDIGVSYLSKLIVEQHGSFYSFRQYIIQTYWKREV